jgi:uncharacterized protein
MITIEQAQALYKDTDPVHDFAHVLRVLKMAEHLAEMEGANVDVVRAAALLHDIARPADDNFKSRFVMSVEPEEDHAMLAAQEARRILADEPSEFVEAVAHAIEAHRFRNEVEPRALEARVLFDADKLDAIGAIGVARAFAFAGAHGMPLWGPLSEDYRPGESAETHTPLHEFHVKLKRIRDRLFTDTGRRIAEARHAFMIAFYEEMAAEVEGER